MTFFGINSKDLSQVSKIRKNLFDEIHEICFHGQGGYDWLTVYNMPTWLRKYTFTSIKNYYSKTQNQSEGENVVINSKGMVKNKKIFQSNISESKFKPQNKTFSKVPVKYK